MYDIAEFKLRFAHKGRSFVLPCPQNDKDQQKKRSSSPPLAYVQAMRMIEDGSPAFLVAVMASSTSSTEKEESEKDLRVTKILENYKDVFQDLPPGLPPERSDSFRINTEGSSPVYSREYRLNPKEKEQVEKQIADFLEKVGFVQADLRTAQLFCLFRRRTAIYACVWTIEHSIRRPSKIGIL